MKKEKELFNEKINEFCNAYKCIQDLIIKFIIAQNNYSLNYEDVVILYIIPNDNNKSIFVTYKIMDNNVQNINILTTELFNICKNFKYDF